MGKVFTGSVASVKPASRQAPHYLDTYVVVRRSRGALTRVGRSVTSMLIHAKPVPYDRILLDVATANAAYLVRDLRDS